MDKIIIKELEFHSHCGTTPAEREIGQRLRATIELYGSISKAAKSDRLESAVDYTRLCDHLLKIGRNSRVCLLETLAVNMAQEILDHFPINEVKILLEKPIPPMEAIRGSFSVEIVRKSPSPIKKKKQKKKP